MWYIDQRRVTGLESGTGVPSNIIIPSFLLSIPLLTVRRCNEVDLHQRNVKHKGLVRLIKCKSDITVNGRDELRPELSLTQKVEK